MSYPRYWRSEYDENAYTLSTWFELMTSAHSPWWAHEVQRLDELKLYACIKDVGGPFFYCQAHQTTGERSDGGCGLECSSYSPRNGKNGICKDWRHAYEDTDTYVILTRDKGVTSWGIDFHLLDRSTWPDTQSVAKLVGYKPEL